MGKSRTTHNNVVVEAFAFHFDSRIFTGKLIFLFQVNHDFTTAFQNGKNHANCPPLLHSNCPPKIKIECSLRIVRVLVFCLKISKTSLWAIKKSPCKNCVKYYVSTLRVKERKPSAALWVSPAIRSRSIYKSSIPFIWILRMWWVWKTPSGRVVLPDSQTGRPRPPAILSWSHFCRPTANVCVIKA